MPWVLVVGRVEPYKRVHESVEAFQQATTGGVAAKLFVVGNLKANPSYAAEVINTAKGCRNIRFLGKISETRLRRLYRKASILMTLSEHEGFCVPILEALGSQTAVLASNAGALAETVGEGGVLVPSGNVDEAARQLRQLLLSPSYFEKVQKAGTQRWAQWDFSSIGRQYLDLLQPAPI